MPLVLFIVYIQMSSASTFSRVVLVKVLSNDCIEELRHNVGKNSHIQSINGHFLDGLSTEQAVEIVHKESEKKCVQLLVRNIHKADQSGSTAGLSNILMYNTLTHVCMHSCMHVHTHTYTRIHTHVHTHAHTHMHAHN